MGELRVDEAERKHHHPSLRPLALGAILLTLIQAGLGMVVNLYATIPDHHPGARPSNYFSGSIHSVGWAIAHGPLALAIHASLGLALVVLAVLISVRTVRTSGRAISIWAIAAGGLIIGAGFNGASFLDFNKDSSSLIMALLAFGALACYSITLYLLTAPAHSPPHPR